MERPRIGAQQPRRRAAGGRCSHRIAHTQQQAGGVPWWRSHACVMLLLLPGYCLVAAAAAGAAGANGCTDDLSCSLNGRCVSGRCRCAVPWTGPTCGRLLTAPARLPGAAVYGYDPNVSSWGGSVVTDADSGTHHLFVAEIPGGLQKWSTDSQCIHAVSEGDLRGPYRRKGVALKPWCHGPQVVRDPATSHYIMAHVGSGVPRPSEQTQRDLRREGEEDRANSGSGFMHHAASPDGPWLPASTGPGKCSMPSIAYHPNGTLFAICGNGHAITRVVSPPSVPVWEAEWSPRVKLTPKGLRGGWEDPDLYFDADEHFHILYHVYTTAHDYRVERCSGHAWSRDGIDWRYSQNEQPFDCTVAFTDGSSRAFATRERPHLVFADAERTTPVGVVSAVSSQPVGPSCNSCQEQACSQCKITPGRDWTYTIMQPFVNFANSTS